MTSLIPDPGTVIESSESWIHVVNRNQNLVGKTMILLVRSCESVSDLTVGEWHSLRTEMRRITAAVEAVLRPDAINYMFLMNADAQVHLHVVPRYAGTREWQGRRHADPHFGEAPGHEVDRWDAERLSHLVGELRAALPDAPDGPPTPEHHHFWPSNDGGFDAWRVDRVVELAHDLPALAVSVEEIDEVDTVYWFDDRTELPTVRRVVEHMSGVLGADLERPIVLGADGRVMDGMHRIAAALLEGRTTVPAVRFEVDPDPDHRGVDPADFLAGLGDES